jgi:Fe-S cluster assembly protein SufD
MILNNIKELNLPSKRDEQFTKISFEKFFSSEFKYLDNYEFDIMGLKTIKDTKVYESGLFHITNNFDNEQKIITINTNILEPIFIIHKLNDDDTFYTNSLRIEVKKGIKATFVEVFINKSKNSAYSVNRSIHLEEDAQLEYAKIQDISEGNFLVLNTDINQEENSNLKITNFEYGNGFIVNTFLNNMNEKKAVYSLNGLIKSQDESNTSNLIKTIHNNSNTLSDVNYKHSLKDKARAVFKVKSIVEKTAPFSKAYQNTNTILLSNDAVIFAQPHLEILIDELEASHGATTGTLDDEQLLYLQSRGISKDKAYEMLLDAFEGKIYDNIDDEQIKEFVLEYKRTNYV